jgi:hypothetical protein
MAFRKKGFVKVDKAAIERLINEIGLLSQLTNVLTEEQLDVLLVLLEGTAKTARQVYREIAQNKIPAAKAKAFGSDAEFEKFLSAARKETKIPAYNSVQKELDRLESLGLVVCVSSEAGIKRFGLNTAFFSAWKEARKNLLEKISIYISKGNKSKLALGLVGLRKIDAAFFKISFD